MIQLRRNTIERVILFLIYQNPDKWYSSRTLCKELKTRNKVFNKKGFLKRTNKVLLALHLESKIFVIPEKKEFANKDWILTHSKNAVLLPKIMYEAYKKVIIKKEKIIPQEVCALKIYGENPEEFFNASSCEEEKLRNTHPILSHLWKAHQHLEFD